MSAAVYDVRVGFKQSDGGVLDGISFSVAVDEAGDATEKALQIVAARLSMKIEPRGVTAADVYQRGAEKRARSGNTAGTAGPSKFWLSWTTEDGAPDPDFLCPWWGRAEAEVAPIKYFAAVKANDDKHAKSIVRDAYGKRKGGLTFRWVDDMPPQWHPFNGRFVREDWMIWNEKVAWGDVT